MLQLEALSSPTARLGSSAIRSSISATLTSVGNRFSRRAGSGGTINTFSSSRTTLTPNTVHAAAASSEDDDDASSSGSSSVRLVKPTTFSSPSVDSSKKNSSTLQKVMMKSTLGSPAIKSIGLALLLKKVKGAAKGGNHSSKFKAPSSSKEDIYTQQDEEDRRRRALVMDDDFALFCKSLEKRKLLIIGKGVSAEQYERKTRYLLYLYGKRKTGRYMDVLFREAARRGRPLYDRLEFRDEFEHFREDYFKRKGKHLLSIANWL